MRKDTQRSKNRNHACQNYVEYHLPSKGKMKKNGRKKRKGKKRPGKKD